MKDFIETNIRPIQDDFRRKQAISNFAYKFAGRSNATLRQNVMLELTGRKIPKAQCGIHAIEKEITNLINQNT